MPDEPATRRDLEALEKLFTHDRTSDKEAIALALNAAEKAVTKADIANEKRLDGLNELRQLTNDQAANFVNREVAEQRWAQHEEFIRTLTDRIAAIEGRMTAIAAAAALLGIASGMYALFR